MKTRRVAAGVVLAAVVIGAGPARGQRDEVAVVRVTGQGIDADAALRDALRRAVEQGGKSEIFARSEVENYELIRDTVLARASGLVSDYRVLRGPSRDAGGVWSVEIEARVKKDVLEATWGEVRMLVEQLGRPRVMVFFAERIFDLNTEEGRREGVLDIDSQLQVLLEQRLLQSGFDLVRREQVEEVQRRRAAEATANGDVGVLQAIAADFGADLFISGTASATGPQVTNSPVGPLYMWETDVTFRAYWAETGQLLFTLGTPKELRRGGSRVDGRPGAKQALENTASRLAEQAVQQLLATWTQEATAGREIVVEVQGVETFSQLAALRTALTGLEGVEGASEPKWKKPVAQFRIQTTRSAFDLAMGLNGLVAGEIRLEVVDQKRNTVICRVVAGTP